MKIKHIWLALTLIGLASCSTEENSIPMENQQEVRVTAGIGKQSRIALNDEGDHTRTLWLNGDRISLFTDTQSNLVYSTSTSDETEVAEFAPVETAVENVEGNTVYACYPEATRTSDEGIVVALPATGTIDYSNGKLESFGYATGTIQDGKLNFAFKHLSAFLCLKAHSDLAGVSQVTVTTTSTTPLNVGEGDTFNFTTQTANLTNGSNTVTVKVDSAMAAGTKDIFIPILPQPADTPITLTATNSNGETIYTVNKQAPATGFQAGYVYRLAANYDTAYLIEGYTFNQRIKSLAGDASNIGHIEFKTEVQKLPSEYVTVSADNSPAPIYASFNATDSTVTVCTPAPKIEVVDASRMFEYLEDLSTIDFGNFLVNEKTTNMSDMFYKCSSLTNLDVANWNTENVTEMSFMFSGCTALTTLDVANWNTQNVTNMSVMFQFCTSLTNLNVANWNTEKVTDMSWMFNYCPALTNLDVANWNTENVTDMGYMFNYCPALTNLDVANWNTENVTDMEYMFGGCSSLSNIDVANWNTENVTNMSSMFIDCSALTTLDVANWNTGKVRDMDYMFNGCSALTTLNVSQWDTGNVTWINYMFDGCSALTTLDVSNWNTENVIYMDVAFRNCSALQSLNVSNWKIDNVRDIRAMFEGCSSLTTLDVSNWNTQNVGNMSEVFKNCSGLTKLDLGKWNTSNVESFSSMFEGCQNLTELNIANWIFNKDTESNWYIDYMFSNCAATSQACKVTSTTATKELLLNNTDVTRMTPEWFIWEGTSYEDLPNQDW